MNEQLRAAIHRYAENREIDYVSAKNLGTTYGLNLKNENELSELKQVIDMYLKTFNESAFEDVEIAFNLKDINEAVDENGDVIPVSVSELEVGEEYSVGMEGVGFIGILNKKDEKNKVTYWGVSEVTDDTYWDDSWESNSRTKRGIPIDYSEIKDCSIEKI